MMNLPLTINTPKTMKTLQHFLALCLLIPLAASAQYTGGPGKGQDNASNLTPSGVTIAPRILLDGPFNPMDLLMRDDLRAASLLPLEDPYPALGLNSTFLPQNVQTWTADSNAFSIQGPNAIVDWVFIELRDPNSPQTVIASRSALLQCDGDVVDMDGNSPVLFDVVAGTYQVAIRHRNHLGCMTLDPVQLATSPLLVDFTVPTTATFGNNARKTLPGGLGLWAGDANSDGVVLYTGSENDRDIILSTIGGTAPTVTVIGEYRSEDINMDGDVKYVGSGNDRDRILETIGGTVPTAFRSEQLP